MGQVSIRVAAGVEIEEDGPWDVPGVVFLCRIPAAGGEIPGPVNYPESGRPEPLGEPLSGDDRRKLRADLRSLPGGAPVPGTPPGRRSCALPRKGPYLLRDG